MYLLENFMAAPLAFEGMDIVIFIFVIIVGAANEW